MVVLRHMVMAAMDFNYANQEIWLMLDKSKYCVVATVVKALKGVVFLL